MHSDAVAAVVAQWRVERPDLDPSPIAIIGRLSRVSRFVHADLVALYRTFDLSEGDFDVLATLRRSGAPFALAPSALTGTTMVTKGAVSRRLDSLEAKGLIEREVAEHDARGRVVRLTDEGFALIERAAAAHIANEHRILAAVPEEDRAELERLLAAWLHHYEQG